MIILIIIFDSHFIHIYKKKKNSIHIICTICILLVLFVSIISTVIFVGKVSNSTFIYMYTRSSQIALIMITAPCIVIGRLVR